MRLIVLEWSELMVVVLEKRTLRTGITEILRNLVLGCSAVDGRANHHIERIIWSICIILAVRWST